MSVLIKGMEMPKNCWLCPLSVLYTKPREMLFCRITKEEVLRNKVDGNCPIVEVPTPHGKLIDAEALKEIEFCGLQADKKIIYQMGWNDAIEAIAKNAPTIIQAEEDE